VSAARLALVAAVAAGLALGGEAQARGRGRTVLKISGSLNLTTANAEQLSRLPGVGPSSARAILERRARVPFTRVEELVRVKGFGKKRFEKLRPFLTLEGATTLKVERLRVRGRERPVPR